MPRPLPTTSAQWLKEILLAWEDAREAQPFAPLTGATLTDAEMFNLAPLVCLKFRRRKLSGKEADKVREGALANYVVNTGPDAPVQGLESHPQMAFALCYVAAHLILNLLDEEQAGEILSYCEEHLPG